MQNYDSRIFFLQNIKACSFFPSKQILFKTRKGFFQEQVLNIRAWLFFFFKQIGIHQNKKVFFLNKGTVIKRRKGFFFCKLRDIHQIKEDSFVQANRYSTKQIRFIFQAKGCSSKYEFTLSVTPGYTAIVMKCILFKSSLTFPYSLCSGGVASLPHFFSWLF